jgi:hypothetical protein
MMDISEIKICLANLKFSKHAKEEMIGEEFGEIEESEVIHVLKMGEIINIS